jgi:hypothetical protein
VPEAAEALAAASSGAAAELREAGRLRGREVPPMVRLEDAGLAHTSSAVAVWQQQIVVVEAAAAAVEAALAQQQQAGRQGQQPSPPERAPL